MNPNRIDWKPLIAAVPVRPQVPELDAIEDFLDQFGWCIPTVEMPRPSLRAQIDAVILDFGDLRVPVR